MKALIYVLAGLISVPLVAQDSAPWRSVVIHEIMADPTPSAGLPEFEFIELYNPGSTEQQLGGWTFVNTLTERILPEAVLAPGEYLLLCDEQDTLYFAPFAPVIGIPSFPALANTGDSLSLVNGEGSVVDVVVYDDSWYGDSSLDDGGHSLIQVNPTLLCSGQGNWAASLVAPGGSPGAANEMQDDTPDTSPPEIGSWQVHHPVDIRINFDEQLDTLASLSIGLAPDAGNVSWLMVGSSLELQTELPLDFEQPYEVTLSGVADCQGNTSVPLMLDFLLGYPPIPGDVMLTEIMADPDESMPSPNAEFVEIENRSAHLLDLSGIALSGGLPVQPVLMESGARLVLCDEDDMTGFPDSVSILVMEDFPALTNTGRLLELTTESELLDAVHYDDGWYRDPEKDEGGYSLELINPEHPCSHASNWIASRHLSGATPGERNSVFDLTPDTVPPVFQWMCFFDDTELGLLFDEPISAANSNVGLERDDGELIEPDSLRTDPSMPHLLRAFLPEQLGEEAVWRFEMLVEDCWGNSADLYTSPYQKPMALESGDLVLNEVLFNPAADCPDFVEVINASLHFISLQGLVLANGAGPGPADPRQMTDMPLIMAPGEIAAFTENKAALERCYPVSVFSPRLVEVEDMPSYPNDAGIVYLLDPLLNQLDALEYNEEMHFGLIADPDGVSLERLHAGLPTQDQGNWHSAASTAGFATPGRENSQAIAMGTTALGFSLVAPIFSPDGDGFQDLLFLEYSAVPPGTMANIAIFDFQGRPVRQWVEQELIGTRGFFAWDGFRDNGMKAAMGRYIILVSTFDLQGNRHRQKFAANLVHQLD